MKKIVVLLFTFLFIGFAFAKEGYIVKSYNQLSPKEKSIIDDYCKKHKCNPKTIKYYIKTDKPSLQGVKPPCDDRCFHCRLGGLFCYCEPFCGIRTIEPTR